jgi:hypothetical protein
MLEMQRANMEAQNEMRQEMMKLAHQQAQSNLELQSKMLQMQLEAKVAAPQTSPGEQFKLFREMMDTGSEVKNLAASDAPAEGGIADKLLGMVSNALPALVPAVMGMMSGNGGANMPKPAMPVGNNTPNAVQLPTQQQQQPQQVEGQLMSTEDIYLTQFTALLKHPMTGSVVTGFLDKGKSGEDAVDMLLDFEPQYEPLIIGLKHIGSAKMLAALRGADAAQVFTKYPDEQLLIFMEQMLSVIELDEGEEGARGEDEVPVEEKKEEKVN